LGKTFLLLSFRNCFPLEVNLDGALLRLGYMELHVRPKALASASLPDPLRKTGLCVIYSFPSWNNLDLSQFSSLKEAERLMLFDDPVAMEACGTEGRSANVYV
jgi:hypothetical protein